MHRLNVCVLVSLVSLVSLVVVVVVINAGVLVLLASIILGVVVRNENAARAYILENAARVEKDTRDDALHETAFII